MSRVIIAAEYVDESQNSTGYFWSKIIAGLKLHGFDVSVLRPDASNDYDSFKGGLGVFKKLIKQLKISFDLTYQIYSIVNEKDIVFTGTNPAILLCLMPFLKRMLGIKWVLLAHDVFPDNLLAARLVSKWNPLFVLVSYYFSWVYASPDKLVCIGRDMQLVLKKKTNGRAQTVFIPNWANGDDVYPLARNKIDLFKDFGWENHVVFQFFGNIGRVQGVNNLLSAISLVTASNAAFVFIGGGAMAPVVEEFIKNNPGKVIEFLGPIPLEKKNDFLAFCDVALVSLEPGMFGLGVPSKTYFSLAAGKPILAAVDVDSEVGLMLSDFPVGWRCDASSPQKLASLIDEICASPQQIIEKNPRKVFLQNYAEDVVLEKFNVVLKSVCNVDGF